MATSAVQLGNTGAARAEAARANLARLRSEDPDRARASDDRLARLKASAAAERQRVTALIARDKPAPAPKKRRGRLAPAESMMAPTPEQQVRFQYQPTATMNDSGQKAGRAYHHRPWFETLYELELTNARREKREAAFDPIDLRALRVYRDAFEATERSEVRSCLAREGVRGEHSVPEASPSLVRARHRLAELEAGLGDLVATMRAIALEDRPYTSVAMERFGHRDVGFDDRELGRYVWKQVPRSGRHPTIVREEFVAGVARLVSTVASQFGRSVPIEERIDGGLNGAPSF